MSKYRLELFFFYPVEEIGNSNKFFYCVQAAGQVCFPAPRLGVKWRNKTCCPMDIWDVSPVFTKRLRGRGTSDKQKWRARKTWGNASVQKMDLATQCFCAQRCVRQAADTKHSLCCWCSVASSCPTFCTLRIVACQASLSLTISECPRSCPLHWWCHPTISSSVTLFSLCPQCSPASELFPMSQLFNQVTRMLELQLQHQSFQWVFRIAFLWDWLIWSPHCPRDSQESSPAPQFEGINSLVLCLLYSPVLRAVCVPWEDHNLEYMDLCRQSDVSAFQHTVVSTTGH